ncbi:hypothetical protein [Virgibacillus ihumii]|uniref:hypothetical protein n=1 Tax=Virgibacillus ihumii TaxID=2686091 RepID=UPI00157BFB9C|nr:hypothetical protein [Virgibacillus ihumii]
MGKAKEYVYFVSYMNQDGGGNIDVTLNEPIHSIKDIREMEEAIAVEYDLDDSVTVLTYQLLES